MSTLLLALAVWLGGAHATLDDDFPCACERLAAAIWADGRIDPDTGRDARNYPPDRVVDFTHMALDILIKDMNDPRFEAVQVLTMTPIAGPVDSLTLDAHLMDITWIDCEQGAVDWRHDADKLVMTFDPPLAFGETAELKIAYVVNDPPRGLMWTPASDDWPGRAAQLHTQGQPETNSYWFPCHDFPHERLSTTLEVTVPPGFVASSNGRLARHAKRIQDVGGDHVPYETFEWVQEQAHPNYLVTLIVGTFDVVDVGTNALPMPVYAPIGRAGDVERTYGRTRRMVELYERLFDEAYPWDRYAQLIVFNYDSGGMENTSATTMYGTAILDEAGALDHSMESLIAHELGHQWFGDLLTCRSWEHIWLNEGFATYLESLWWEEVDGEDGYLRDVLMNMDQVIEADAAEAPDAPGMVSKEYVHPWDVFDRAANPYPKGASILHMLRAKLGDDVFYRSVAAYIDRHKGESVETRDLRLVMEEVSGESLEQFFDQWCERPGVPRLDIDIAWNDGLLTLRIVQTQNIDPDNPAFAFDLPVWIDDGREAIISVNTRETTATFQTPREPDLVCVNPRLEVLAEIDVTQAWRGWRSQVLAGPTLPARVQGVRALSAYDDDTTTRLLSSVASSPTTHVRVREEAVIALGERGAVDSLAALTAAAPYEIRLATVKALAEAIDAETPVATSRSTNDRITALATGDPSARVRAAALTSIGRLRLLDRMDVVTAALSTESQHDRVRQAALGALGDLDDPAGLELAIRYAQPGVLYRTRPRAIDAIAKLAHHDPSTAYYALEGLLDDRERRTWEAAARALVTTGDERAIDALTRLAEEKRDPADQAWILERRAELN